jgi:hypothetical protein
VEAGIVVEDDAKISILLQQRIQDGLEGLLRAGVFVA